jgi:pantoate--beta-alanine ligase
MPTVREPDGLAMSSRNSYLSPSQRSAALGLSRALEAARKARDRGEKNARALVQAARVELARDSSVAVEYVECRDACTLEEITTLSAPVVIAIAARVGQTRLIDNVVLEPPAGR